MPGPVTVPVFYFSAMDFKFDSIIEREGTDCFKYDFRKEYFGNGDVIPMWVADMDFAVPPAVKEALKKRADHPIYGYSVLSDDYYNAFINWVRHRHQWEIEKDWIRFSPGVVTALNLLVQTFTETGDRVIVQPPVYFPFFWAVEKNGRVLVHNTLREQNGVYSIDFEDLEDKMKAGARMMILCSPHNPVGRAWKEDELRRIGELCLEYKVILLSDEIHSDLALPPHKHIPMASLSEEIALNTITCMAPSKTFNLAGLFTSSIIIRNEEWLKIFKETEERVHLSPNLFGAVAAEAAYREGVSWLDELLKYLEGNYRLLRDFLSGEAPYIIPSPLEATYLVWLDFRGTGLPNNEIKRILIEEAGVGLNDGRVFGEGGSGFQRMNLGCPTPVVKKAITRISEAFSKHIK